VHRDLHDLRFRPTEKPQSIGIRSNNSAMRESDMVQGCSGTLSAICRSYGRVTFVTLRGGLTCRARRPGGSPRTGTRPAFRLVDPDLEQARRGDVASLVAYTVRVAQARGQALVVSRNSASMSSGLT